MKVVQPAVVAVVIHELPLKFNLLANHSQSLQARAEVVETTSELMVEAALLQEILFGVPAVAVCQESSQALI